MSTLTELCLLESDTSDAHTLADYDAEQPRWCSGCGDHGVLAGLQRVLRKHNLDPENVVSVSGIGCSSRFPYYVDSYGFHSIHGRAPAVATGLKVSRPDLEVWIATGDGPFTRTRPPSRSSTWKRVPNSSR